MGIETFENLEFEVSKHCEAVEHLDPESEFHADGPLYWVLMHPCRGPVPELTIKCQRYVETNWEEEMWICIYCHKGLTPDEFMKVIGPVE